MVEMVKNRDLKNEACLKQDQEHYLNPVGNDKFLLEEAETIENKYFACFNVRYAVNS